VAVAAAKMGTMQPLPLAPSGSFHVAGGVDFLEDADGSGSVFLWGMAAWCWQVSPARLDEHEADMFREHVLVNMLSPW